ncbi:hypothetical protein [Corynebacterium aquilae]|nr:hypothetical protein [Corynebacterium aquilae]
MIDFELLRILAGIAAALPGAPHELINYVVDALIAFYPAEVMFP